MEPQATAVEGLKKEFERARETAPAAEVRATALAYYRARAELGGTQEQIAEELGVNRWTLAKWYQRRNREPQQQRGPEVPQPSSPASTEAKDALKQEIEQLGPRKPSRRFPRELKERIVAWARGELARGIPTGEVADQLGMPWESIAKWMGRCSGTSAASATMRAVHVIGHTAAGERPRSPVLRTPGGYIVEGLDLAALAQLLRALG